MIPPLSVCITFMWRLSSRCLRIHTLQLGWISILWPPTYFMHKVFNFFANIIIQHCATILTKVHLLFVKCRIVRECNPCENSNFVVVDICLSNLSFFCRLSHNWSLTTKGWETKTRHLWPSYQVIHIYVTRHKRVREIISWVAYNHHFQCKLVSPLLVNLYSPAGDKLFGTVSLGQRTRHHPRLKAT